MVRTEALVDPSRSVERRGALVTVVVAGYSLARLNDIRDLLDSLRAQTYPNLEIIFVGEGPPELCEEVRAHAQERGLTRLEVVVNRGVPGLSPARNVGAQHARGDIIAFIDDDAVAFPDWVEGIVSTFSEHPEAIGVTGPAFPRWESESMRWFPEEFFWILSCPTPGWTGLEKVTAIRNAWGMNMAFRREAFVDLRFSEAFVGGNQGTLDGSKVGLLGDDTEFCLRLSQATGRCILYNPAVRVFHKVYQHRLTPRFVRRRAFWEGYTKATLVKLRRGQEDSSMNLTMEHQLLRRILFRFFPRALAGCVVHPALGLHRLTLGVGVLFHVAMGYGAGRFAGLGRFLLSRYGA